MNSLSPQISMEERFQLFLDGASDYAIYFTDVQGAINEWSSGAEKILGYSESEALELNGSIVFTEEDRAHGVPKREMEVAARHGQAIDERWHMRKNRERFFAVGRLIALKDKAGKLYGFTKIMRDATPSKALERALHASDEQFRATFAQAPLGMVMADLGGRIQQVNAAFTRLLGFTPHELEGRDILSLTAAEHREAELVLVKEMMAGKRASLVMEKQLQRSDGSLVWVQNSAALLRDSEGQPMTIIDLCQDISALKMSAAELERLVNQRTAALQDKTKQMEALCYTVAHDLRAPLRAIAGFSELLRQDFGAQLPPEALGYLHTIEASTQRLDGLINDLLGYTRIEQIALLPEEIDLTSLVNKLLGQMKEELRVEGSVIQVIPPLGIVQADRVTLEHVFINLISNAVKFRRPDVAPEVRISSEDKGDQLRVWVEDNGIGVDPRFKDRIFGMFERLHSKREIPGTGVGLAIVATAMERLGGDRGVEPNEPFGSRFWIEFRK